MHKGSVVKKPEPPARRPKANASSSRAARSKPVSAKPASRSPVPTTPAIVKHDLLAEPLLGVDTASGRSGVSLPDVLAELGAEGVRAFTGLQAHQQHAWHAFLVQLAAIALHRAGESNPRQTPATWRKLLLALTEGSSEPWCLVVGDLSKPAFLQPPVPEKTLEDYKPPVLRPDEIDVLVTSKNHDVKAARVGSPRPEHWVYALVSLQTMEGYSGKTKYGIARMNGGFASRAGIGLAPSLDLARRWSRDVRVLLAAREGIVRDRYAPDGHALLWLLPWDGKKALNIQTLDPYFIEICRRMRLVDDEGVLAARYKPTDVARVRASELKGNTGDPWNPVARAEAAAFTATKNGFDYRTLQRLLGDEFVPGAALRPQAGEKDLLLVASVLARGQGETNGFHQRTLPIPERGVNLLRSREASASLAKLARERVNHVAAVKVSVLKPAVLTLLQGARERLDFKDKRADRWLERLDAAVDREFFERLWADHDADRDIAQARWEKWLLELSREQLRDAIESAPMPDARAYRCIAAAERVFEGAARKCLVNAYSQEVASEQQS